MCRWFVIPLAAALAGGCQTYQAQPLDSESILRSWSERSSAVASSGPSTREAETDRRVIDLAEAEALALLLNPTLRTARLEANIAAVSASEAGRWSDPSLGLDLERILSGVDDPWVIGGIVNLTLPLSGRLQVEKRLAGADAERAQLRVLWHERQTIAELRRAWVEWHSAKQRSRVLARSIDDLATVESSTRRLLDAGEIDPTEARLFTIVLVRQRVQLLDANRDATRFEARVRQLIGLTPGAPIALSPDAAVPTVRTDSPALESHPRLLVARADYAAAERSLELEIRRQYPDLEIGGGFGTDQGDERLLGGVSIPIPVLNANRRTIAEATARRDMIRAAYEAELQSLVADRLVARDQLQAAQAALEAIETQLVPLVDRQVSEARQLLQAGEFNPLVVREAIAAATEARIDLISARRALSLAHVEHLLLTETTPSATQVKP